MKLFKKENWPGLFRRRLRIIAMDTSQEGKYTVVQVEPESENLRESLGITQERAKDIVAIIMDALRANPRKCAVMHSVSKKMLHPNELFFASYILRDVIQAMENPLGGFLGGMIIAAKKDGKKE